MAGFGKGEIESFQITGLFLLVVLGVGAYLRWKDKRDAMNSTVSDPSTGPSFAPPNIAYDSVVLPLPIPGSGTQQFPFNNPIRLSLTYPPQS